jgi:hypothetical protein
VTVPRRRRQRPPRLHRVPLELPRAKALERTIGPHRVPQPPERLRVGAAARGGEVRLGEERVDRLTQDGRALADWA